MSRPYGLVAGLAALGLAAGAPALWAQHQHHPEPEAAPPAAEAPADPHAGHGTAGKQTDPHAGHSHGTGQPADPHAGHDMSGQGADPHAGHAMPAPLIPDGPPVSLADLERRALASNPALRAAEAALQASEGRARQAGALPNPIVGYSGEELPLESGREGGKHGFFVAQDLPLGGKLRLDRQLAARDLDGARLRAEAERLGFLAELRRLFARTLAAERRTVVRTRLAAVALEAVAVTEQLYNTGSADAPDLLAIENEASLREAALAGARLEVGQLRAALASAVAEPGLVIGPLTGDLEADLPRLQAEEWRTKILAESPALRSAQASAARAEAALARARAARSPDLVFEGGVRRDSEPISPGGPAVGNQAFADVGVRLPLWNRNQGGIAAAEADLARARLEGERARLRLESRFAAAFAGYRQAAVQAEAYRASVERARQAYRLYLGQYRQMQAAYPQVLIAQRSLFDLEEGYVDALARAWDGAVAIQSLLVTDGDGMSGLTGIAAGGDGMAEGPGPASH